MCASGGFKLTKFISNSRRVLETVPIEDHAKGLKDLNLTFDSLPIERALGMYWNVENVTYLNSRSLWWTSCLLAEVYLPQLVQSMILLVSLDLCYCLVDVLSSKFVVREKVGMNLFQMK